MSETGEPPDLDTEARAQVQIEVCAARHVADAIAQMHRTAVSDARSSILEHRWLTERLAAELRNAKAALQQTLDPSWATRTNAHEMVELYELARIWHARDPDAAQAERQILHTLETRYGIRADALRPNEGRP